MTDTTTESSQAPSAQRRDFLKLGAAALAMPTASWSANAALAAGAPALPGGEITGWTAIQLAQAIQSRQVSCVEVMKAYLAQIERLNPKVNAIVSLQPMEGLLSQAAERDAQLARGERMGWMHGFPQAPKDLANTAGIVTTQGSPILRNNVPKTDAIIVERARRSGAILIGKTNTPEFGLGSHTYNTVFGTTGNAYDPSKSAGGSSGGAAVSLALRMLPVADGSDMMGSLRNPAGGTTFLACARRWVGCPLARLQRCITSNWVTKVRWGAPWPTWPCCCRCRPVTMPVCPCRWIRTRPCSRGHCSATSRVRVSAGWGTSMAICLPSPV